MTFKEIVETRDFFNSADKSLKVGEYVITGIQAGNLKGQRGWDKYIGYVVQIRKDWGSFGSDLVFLRHPDGELITHENQSFHRMSGDCEKRVKEMFKDGVTPDEMEDYTKAYTIGDKHPEIGKVIECKENDREKDERPLMDISVTDKNGNITITRI